MGKMNASTKLISSQLLNFGSKSRDDVSKPCYDILHHFRLLKEINDVLPILHKIQNGITLSSETVEEVRNKLLTILNQPTINLAGTSLNESCHEALLAIARRYPLNDVDPISGKKIVPGFEIYTATGICYNNFTFRLEKNEIKIGESKQAIKDVAPRLDSHDIKHIKDILQKSDPTFYIVKHSYRNVYGERLHGHSYNSYSSFKNLTTLKDPNFITLDEYKKLSSHQKKCLANSFVWDSILQGDIDLLKAMNMSYQLLNVVSNKEVFAFMDKYQQPHRLLFTYSDEAISNLSDHHIRKIVMNGDFSYDAMLHFNDLEHRIVSHSGVYPFLKEQGKTPAEIITLTQNEFNNLVPSVREAIERGDYTLEEALNFTWQQRQNEIDHQHDLEAGRVTAPYMGM